MGQSLDVDYLVIGAGATGMAFTDALVDHADVRVALVDRRHAPGGHWLKAYPFVRLHQSSTFYGVASTLLGGGRVQTRGPEAGLHERADKAGICSYFADVLADRLEASGRVELLAGCEYVGDRTVVSRISGRRHTVPERCRIVDARYLSPDIPAESPPRFTVGDGARVVPVNFLPHVEEAPGCHVVVGSGKTATDACVWLLANGVDPDAICWIRPREPWMLNRAKIQPEPEIFLGMVADLLQAVAGAPSLPDLFVRLEDLGIMLRIDRSVTPTMAKTPTLATWELDELRSIEDVVRLGHVTTACRGRIDLEQGSIAVPGDALVVDCAADGLKRPPLIPIWRPEVITPQPVRAGFPCFGAALAGYVEATRSDDAEKNRLCPPSPYGNTLADWAQMNLLGLRNAAAFGAEPDIREWSAATALNPARIPPGHDGSAALDDAITRIGAHSGPAVARLAELAAVG
ncbi:NAD(P)-binding protein [Nocardioides sp. YIM 152315]|uniref:NAD(P)-binding protein n=1 Tax=Nocardioides sp. YIM 152315 TaxID=3031760 RepID=UPI0023DB242D|nr:NAD(P)-binding protein [Nocardioides sp. YIM 152315]MDF1605323.1 NAD(P)-binding protein [Nocardioides sp. YIM 152315]